MKLSHGKYYGTSSWKSDEYASTLRERERERERESKIPVLTKVEEVYLLWHVYYRDMPKISRQTLGNKIDELLLDFIAALLKAAYAPKSDKLQIIKDGSTMLDTIKLLLKISWKAKALDNKKYITMSNHLDTIGKMLGGWQKSFY